MSIEPGAQVPLAVIGAYPPPVNGYAAITSGLEQLVKPHRRTIRIDISPGTAKRGVRYHATRIARVAAAFLQLVRLRLRAGRFDTYIATESRLGLLYTLTLALAARVLGSSLYLHHHVFRYIDEKSALMRVLVSLTQQSATHIFLCSCMKRDFARAYARTHRSATISNLAFVPLPASSASPRDPGASLVVSHLSNLTREKGLYTFLALAEAAVEAGLDARFLLAGPVMDEADRGAIEETARRLGARFEYRGPLFGPDKEAFYRECDIFAFPTIYENEAQPMVLFEALLHGCQILSYDRGCIAEQVGDSGWVIGRDEDFLRAALPILKGAAGTRHALARLKERTSRGARAEHAEALQSVYTTLLSAAPRSAPRLTFREMSYDALRALGSRAFERAFGTIFLCDAQAKMSKALVAAAPRLSPILRYQIPRAYRERGVIFIHIPKNAGTAVSDALYGRSFTHFSASFLRTADPAFFSSVPSVALLRDPVERAISAYRHIRQGGGAEIRLHPRSRAELGPIQSFDDFLDYLAAQRHALGKREFVLRPQCFFVCDRHGKPIVSELFVMGHHDAAFAQFLGQYTSRPLERRNASVFPAPAPTVSQCRAILGLYADDVALIEEVIAGRGDTLRNRSTAQRLTA